MRRLIAVLLILFSSSIVFSQIAGVSNDKLIVVGAESIGTRTVEFEPGFGYIWSKKSFDNNGNLVSHSPDNDSILVLQALGFRFTYGFAKNFEIGTTITSTLDVFSVGMKYTFINRPKFLAGAFLGTTFNNESDLVIRNTGIFGKTVSIVGGFAFMNRFLESERLTLDYDLQYQSTFDADQIYSDDVFAAVELGYMFKNAVQLIGGFNYRFNNFRSSEMDNSWLLTWNMGITTKPGKMFVIIVNVPVDIAGRNAERFTGFQVVLTIGLD